MNRTVNCLEESGYLTRTPDENDRRKVNIALTDAGRDVVEETVRRRDAWLEAALAALPPDAARAARPGRRDHAGGGGPVSAMFRSFSVFNYRVWFIGALVSNIGAWMQNTALSWVVLTELTDNDAGRHGHHDGAAVRAARSFSSAVTGWVADRFDRRRLMAVTQSLLLLLGLAIGILLLTGVMTLGIMYGFALALGVVAAFDNPIRQAFVSDLVARENASNAVALNAASFNGARMIGPAVAGIVIVAVGTGWVFLVNGVTFLGDDRRARPHPARPSSSRGPRARAPDASPTASATSASAPTSS